jgi:hypothetical protein
MKYRFHCKVCHKIKLLDSKEELEAENKKHWIGQGQGRKHVPIQQTVRIEMRTSNSGNPYFVYVAE